MKVKKNEKDGQMLEIKKSTYCEIICICGDNKTVRIPDDCLDIMDYAKKAFQKFLRKSRKQDIGIPYSFIIFERLEGKSEAGTPIKSKPINTSKEYFMNAKFVSLNKLEKEAHEEACAEPWTSDDARDALKALKNGKCEKVFQSMITDYFFPYDEKKHVLL